MAKTGRKVKYNFFAHTYSAYGSSDNKIVRFSTTLTDTGDGVAWTTTDNAANAHKWTFLKSGMLWISAWMNSAVASDMFTGISLNASDPTAFIYSIAGEERLSLDSNSGIGGVAFTPSTSAGTSIAVNDVIRVHTDANVPNTAARCGVNFIFEAR